MSDHEPLRSRAGRHVPTFVIALMVIVFVAGFLLAQL